MTSWDSLRDGGFALVSTRSLCGLVAIVSSVLLPACRSGGHHSVVQSDVDFRLDEVSDSSRKIGGEDVKLRFTLTNRSRANHFRVNARGLLGGERSPDVVRDVWLRVVHQSTGEHLDFDCRIKGGAAGSDEYLTLPPGGNLSFVRDLRCFRLAPAGKYLITAQIDVPVPPDMIPLGARPVPVPLSSNRVDIEIAAAP